MMLVVVPWEADKTDKVEDKVYFLNLNIVDIVVLS
jgi:hypothetical protein